MADKPVSKMTRDELNAHATTLGVEGADEMQNAEEVIAAIQAAEADADTNPNQDQGAQATETVEPQAAPRPAKPWISNDRTRKRGE